MSIKMTTNSQLSTIEPKKQKQKQKTLSKQLAQEQNQRNGHHMKGYQWERGRGRMREKVQGIRRISGRYKIERGRLRIV